MLHTSDFPQADRIWQVYGVVRAVASGDVSDAQIEAALGLASGARQGRYYRLAAEKMGFLRNSVNQAELTSTGLLLATAPNREDAKQKLRAGVLACDPLRMLYEYASKSPKSRQQLCDYYVSIYPGSKGSAKRRFSTARSYLVAVGLMPGEASDLDATSDDVGSYFADSPTRFGEGTHSPFPPLPTEPSIAYQYEVDAQKVERANSVHRWLVDQTSFRLNTNQIGSASTPHIDLMATNMGETVIYEMKSISEGHENFHAQIRKAVAQLEEYRFRFALDAALCIVTNAAVPSNQAWIENYLAHDRSIAHIWLDEDGNVNASDTSRLLLAEWM